MRTLDPANTLNDFIHALSDVEMTWFAVRQNPNISTKLVAEYSFLASAILLEGFISDLFVAMISQKRDAFVDFLLNGIEAKAIGDKLHYKFAARAERHITLGLKNLSHAEIRSVLDAQDFNVTFKNVEDMMSKASLWLSTDHRHGFKKLTGNQIATLNATRAIRNFLAHRSAAADETMQEALSNSRLPAPLRRGKHRIKDVGSWLEAKPGKLSGDRMFYFLLYMLKTAETICPK